MFGGLGFMFSAAAGVVTPPVDPPVEQPAGTPIITASAVNGNFSRASAGTYTNGSGIILLAPAETPRFQNGRLLLERGRTNHIKSAPLGDGWFLNGVDLTANAGASPDGAGAATLITANTDNSRHNVETFAYVPSYQHNALSGYFKHAGHHVQLTAASGGGRAYAYFDLLNGVVGAVGAVDAYSTPSGIIHSLGNGLYRCALCYYSSEGEVYASANLSDRLTHTGDMVLENPSFVGAGGGAYCWGLQLENGGSESTIITTDAPPTTRTGDRLIYTLPAGKIAGTLVGQFRVPSLMLTDANRIIAVFYDGTVEMNFFIANNEIILGRWNGSDWVATTVGNVVPGTLYKFALGWGGGSAAIALNGSAALTLDGVSTSPYPFVALGGRGNSSQLDPDELNGELGMVYMHDTRMTNTQLTAASA